MKPLSAPARPLLAVALGLVFAIVGATGGSDAGAAVPPPGATMLLAQADTSGTPVFEGDEGDEEDEVPIPPNLQDKEMVPDTAAAVPDTLREALPANPGLTDTLHMPTGQPPKSGAKPAPGIPSAPATPRGSLFGLAPIIVIGAIVAATVLLIRTVGGE